MTTKKVSLYRQQKLLNAGVNPDESTHGRSSAEPVTPIYFDGSVVLNEAYVAVFGHQPSAEDLSSVHDGIINTLSPNIIKMVTARANDKHRRPSLKEVSGDVHEGIRNVKSEWMTDLRAKVNSDIEHELRFGFDGEIIPYTSEVDVRLGLHHHGDEPEAAGYKLQELLILMRSSMAGQQRIALLTLTEIARRARLGLFGNEVFDHLFDFDVVLAARTLLDSSAKPVVFQAVKFFFALLLGDENVEPLSFIEAALLVHTDLYTPCSRPEITFASASDPSEVSTNTFDFLNAMDDSRALRVDLVYGLVFRLELGSRLLYLMEKVLAPDHDVVQINNSLSILAFVCRHSEQVAEKLFCLPSFCSVVIAKSKSRVYGYSALRLLKFASLASRYATESLASNPEFLNVVFEWAGDCKEAEVSSNEEQEAHLQAQQILVVFAAYDLDNKFLKKIEPLLFENMLTCGRINTLTDASQCSTFVYKRLTLNFHILYQCVRFGKGIQHERKVLDSCIKLATSTVVRWLRLLTADVAEFGSSSVWEKLDADAIHLLNAALLYVVEEVQNVGVLQRRAEFQSLFRPVFRALAALLGKADFYFLQQLETLALPVDLVEFHASCVDVPTRQVAVDATSQRCMQPHVLSCLSDNRASSLNMLKFVHKYLFVYATATANDGASCNAKEDADDMQIVCDWLAKWLKSCEAFVANNLRDSFTWHTRPIANASGLALLCLHKIRPNTLQGNGIRQYCTVLSHLLPEDEALSLMLTSCMLDLLAKTDAAFNKNLMTPITEQLVRCIENNSGLARTLNGKIDSFLTRKNYGTLLLPKGWEILPLFTAVERCRKEQSKHASVEVYEQVLVALKFLLLLLQSTRNVEEVRNYWPFTISSAEIYTELGRLFLLTSKFPPAIQEFNGISFAGVMRQMLPLVVDCNASSCLLGELFTEKYSELLDDYESTSYGDLLYSQFILVPLRADMPVKLKLIFWRKATRPGCLLRLLSLRHDDLLYKADGFILPDESDLSLLGIYCECLLERLVSSISHPLLYKMLVLQVAGFVNNQTSGTCASDQYRQRLRETLIAGAGKELLADLKLGSADNE